MHSFITLPIDLGYWSVLLQRRFTSRSQLMTEVEEKAELVPEQLWTVRGKSESIVPRPNQTINIWFSRFWSLG